MALLRLPVLRLPALGLLALVAACAAPGSSGRFGPPSSAEFEALEDTWFAARVALPGAAPVATVAAAPRPQGPGRLPVVVFAHGCAGLDAETLDLMQLIAGHGFAAVAPDHRARVDASRPCPDGPRTAAPQGRGRREAGFARRPTPGFVPPIQAEYVARRLDEVAHAVARVRELPWADPERIYVVGHSLGRDTAPLWPTEGLAGVAVLGAECSSTEGLPGLGMPLAVALLPLADRRGGLAAERARAPLCGDLAMRAEFGGVVVDRAAGLATMPETRRALLDFLVGRVTRT